MPSLYSLSTLGAVAVCLAQAWAVPQYGSGNGGSGGWGSGGQGSGGQGSGQYGGQGGGSGGGGGGYGGYGQGSGQQQDQSTITATATVTQTMMMTMTETMMMTMGAQTGATVTVTAIAPCNSVVTAYVNTCSAAYGASMWPPVAGANAQPQLTTISFQNFQQGLSSIPVDQAVMAGVTVAAAAPPAATMSTSMTSWAVTSAVTSPAAAAVQDTGVAGSTFTTTGPVSDGLSSIPNPYAANPAATPAVSPAAAQVAPDMPTVSSAVATSALTYSNSGVLGVGAKRWVVAEPTAA